MIERRVRTSGEVVWRVRWRDHVGRNRSREVGSKRAAQAFDDEMRRRRRTGELALFDASRETLDEYVTGTWVRSYAAHLAPRTRQVYTSTYDRHIAPRLGGTPLREIDADTVGAFQSDLIASGVGPHAIRKAMTLLGALLQRAAEGRRIPYNPQRVVRKARLPLSPEVRPLAPVRVEAMRRAAANLRDAPIVSVLAYSGLRPGELRELLWCRVRERTLLVDAAKTGRRRTVRLLVPLAADLALWRATAGDTRRRPPGVPGRAGRRLDCERLREVAPAALQRAAPVRGRCCGPAVRPAPQLRLAPTPRGPRRHLRRAPARARRGPDAAHLRARDRGAGGLAAAAGGGGDRAGSPDPREPTRNPQFDGGIRGRARIPRSRATPRPGFEPGAYSLGGSRSIQLSYRGSWAGIVVPAAKRTARYAP